MDQQIFGDFHVRGRLKGIGKTAQEILKALQDGGVAQTLNTISTNTQTIQNLTKCIHKDVDHKMDEVYHAIGSITSGGSNTTENSYKVIPITIAVDNSGGEDGRPNDIPDYEDETDPDATTDYDKYFTNKYVVKVNYHGIEVIGDAYTTKNETESLITTPYIPNCLLIDGKLYDKSYKMLTPTYTPIEEITKSMLSQIKVTKDDSDNITCVVVTENEIETKYQYDATEGKFTVTVDGALPVAHQYYEMSIDGNELIIKAGQSKDNASELFRCDLSNYSITPTKVTDYELIGDSNTKLTITQSGDNITNVFDKVETLNVFGIYEIDLKNNNLTISGTAHSADNNGTHNNGSITCKDGYLTIKTDEKIFGEFILSNYTITGSTTTYERITTTEVPKTANSQYKFNFQCPSGCTSIYMLPNFFDPHTNVFPTIGNTLQIGPVILGNEYVCLAESTEEAGKLTTETCAYLYTYNKSTKAPPRLLPWKDDYTGKTVNIKLSSATLVYDSETYYPLFMCKLSEEDQDDNIIYLIKHGKPHLKTYKEEVKLTIDDTHGGGDEHENLLENPTGGSTEPTE